jgi:hypothetical protein
LWREAKVETMNKLRIFHRLRHLGLLGAWLITWLAAGCGQAAGYPSATLVAPVPTSVNTPSQPIGTAVPTTLGPVAASYVTAQSIQELTTRSTEIAIGHVTQMAGVINDARDVNDRTKPDPILLAVGQIYHFTVDQTLKGTLSPTIDILQVEGWMIRGPVADPTSMTGAEDALARKNYEYIPLRPGVRYLVFLAKPFILPPNQYYGGIAQPWRFDLSDQAMVRPESPWHDASWLFPAQPLSSVLSQIQNPSMTPVSTPLSTPYP